jgi:hypothetical protein
LNTLTQVQVGTGETVPAPSNYKLLRVGCWVVALALGAAQAWASRFTMNPDGVSYLDIGDAYWRGDWHNAINAYWSPLYSWILGLFLKLLKPSPYWEYPVVHIVNFFIYVGALACFEFFLATFIAHRQKLDRRLSELKQIGFPEPAWWFLGYSLFVSCSLVLIGLALVTPDMCVAAFVYLAAALLLKIRGGAATRRTRVAFGVVLGFAYLAKAVMFPLGLVFLSVAILPGRSKKHFRHYALASGAFLAVAMPFIVVLSHMEDRVTFSDVGPVAYEVYVDGVDQFVPTAANLTHPIRKLLSEPLTHEFDQPIHGTYPLWYNSAYWHAGLKPYFSAKGEWRVIRFGMLVYFTILNSVHLAIGVALLALVAVSPSPLASCRRIFESWPLFAPCLVALIAYWLVYTEFRYVAPFVLLLWLCGFSGLAYPDSMGSRGLLKLTAVAIAATTLIFQGVSAFYQTKFGFSANPTYWRAARALSELGVRQENTLAVVASEPFGDGGAFVARLNRSRIVAQTPTQDTAWLADTRACSRYLNALANVGVKVVLWHGKSPSNSAIPWTRLDSTDYYVHLLTPVPAPPP